MILKGNMNLFTPKFGDKVSVFTLITYIQNCCRGPSQHNKARKQNKILNHKRRRMSIICSNII